jgi:hypothetical protein
MKFIVTLGLLLGLGILVLEVQRESEAQTPTLTASLSLGASLGDIPRIGVNLGHRTVWGAEQFMTNVLRNPGLEPIFDGALIVVARSSATGVEDDSKWMVRPENFWAGAKYEVLSGREAGLSGRVLTNRQRSPDSGDHFMLHPMPSALSMGDAIAVRGQQDPNPAPLWWTEGYLTSVETARPGSPGRRSVALRASVGQPARLLHHLDSIGARAGKLLPVQGPWRLSLWVRAQTDAARLDIRFERHGQAPWLQGSLTPGRAWQQIVLDFDASDTGPPGPLQLSLSVAHGELLIDDIELGARLPSSTPGGFRPEVVNSLRALQPGYLRDWQGQLADLPGNRNAEALGRQPIRYRPGDHEVYFAYSVSEFLELAAAVDARPWLILPATATPSEAREMGRQIAEAWRHHRFDEIVVEHGNEHWNPTFRPAGIADVAVLAEVADRAFSALREGAGTSVPLHRVLGVRDGDPGAAGRMARLSRQSEGIAVAPYFHRRQSAGEPTAQALQRALHEEILGMREALQEVRGHGRSIDVYEVNFHTTEGDASASERGSVLVSPQAGAALMRRLLLAAELGVMRQAVYKLAGHDHFVGTNPRTLVPLFGITNDLASAGNWRSTGRALLALNAVMGGNAYRVNCSGRDCSELVALAWELGERAVLVSSATNTLELNWPCRSSVTVRTDQTLPMILDCAEGRVQLRLPPQSWMTLSTTNRHSMPR